MKKALLIVAALCAAASSQAVITTVSETASEVALKFKLTDTAFPGSTSETFYFSQFPGTSVVFNFTDRLFFFGNLESLETNPSSGSFSFVQNSGELDFFGSYQMGNKLVNWEVDSYVGTNLGSDYWKGSFTATASQVPDTGASLALLGGALLALVGWRRRFHRG